MKLLEIKLDKKELVVINQNSIF